MTLVAKDSVKAEDIVTRAQVRPKSSGGKAPGHSAGR